MAEDIKDETQQAGTRRASNKGKPNRSDAELLLEVNEKAQAIRNRISRKQTVRLEDAVSRLAGKKISIKDLGDPKFDEVLDQLEEIAASR